MRTQATLLCPLLVVTHHDGPDLAKEGLWIQGKIHENIIKLDKVRGDQNPSDILTKFVSAELIKNHLNRLQFVAAAGKAQTAPTTLTKG